MIRFDDSDHSLSEAHDDMPVVADHVTEQAVMVLMVAWVVLLALAIVYVLHKW